MVHIRSLIMLGGVSLMLSSTAWGASFDCKKASSFIEHTICSESELSKLDEDLLTAYKISLDMCFTDEAIKQTKQEQRQWLKNVRNACTDVSCLKRVYKERIETLAPPDGGEEIVDGEAELDAANLPTEIGACVDGYIGAKNTRFDNAVAGEAGGEVYVWLTNEVDLYIVEIANLPEEENPNAYMYTTDDFKIGDKINLCLVSVPSECPEGDERGKVYEVTNYKNAKRFTGVDAWHSCGGA